MWARADPASQDKLVPCPKTISAQTKVSQILCGHGALRSVKHFHSWVFSQLEFPPPISALSDRGSFSLLGFFRGWDFLHRSRRSQIGGVFSQLGFFHSWDFLHRSWRCWDFFVVGSWRSQIGGVFSQLGFFMVGMVFHSWHFSQFGSILRLGFFHSWDFLHQSRRSQIGGVFSQLGFFTVGISSTNLIFSQVFSRWEFFSLQV